MEDRINAQRTYGIAICISFAFLCLRVFHLPWLPFAVNGDETLFFARALRLNHGQVLYRDVFELVTPGTELLYALGFLVFGVHGWVIAAWHMVLGISLGLAITSIARKILSGAAVFLPLLLFLAFDLSSAMDATHHWWSTLCVLTAVAVLIRGWESWRIVTCGVFCGMATLFTQTQGFLALAAIALYVAIEARWESKSLIGRLVPLVVPYASLCTAVLGYYGYVAGVRRLYFDLLKFPVTGLSGPMNSPRAYLHQFPLVHGASDLVRLIPFVIILGLVPYGYVFSLVKIFLERGDNEGSEQRSRMTLLNLVGVALFVAICSGPRFFRICTVAPPALLVCSSLIQHGGKIRTCLRMTLWAAVGMFTVWLPIHRQLQWHQTLMLPTGAVAFTDPGQWQEYRWLQRHTSAGNMMFNNAGAILYLGLRNPMHTELVNNDDFTSPQDVQSILNVMKTQPPLYVALDPDIPETPRDHAGPFRDYVHTHYSVDQSFLIGPNKYREELWSLH